MLLCCSSKNSQLYRTTTCGGNVFPIIAICTTTINLLLRAENVKMWGHVTVTLKGKKVVSKNAVYINRHHTKPIMFNLKYVISQEQ